MRQATLRLWNELFHVLRREGLPISTAEALTAVRALELLDWRDPQQLRDGLAAVLAHDRRELAIVDQVFAEFFRPGVRGKTLAERLAAMGLDASERSVVLDWLRAHDTEGGVTSLTAWLGSGMEHDRLLSQSATLGVLRREADTTRLGFLLHRVLEEARLPQARSAASALDLYLRDALGSERGRAIAQRVKDELRREEQRLQRALRSRVEERQAAPVETERAPLASLGPEERARVERTVLRLAERLVARTASRRRKARRGVVDLRATRRLARRTAGLPVQLVRRVRREAPARLFVLCDVSDSVRSVAHYLLHFLYHAQSVWSQARTFVFVSDVGETTEAFRRHGVDRALQAAYSGEVVATTHNSGYGRALLGFEALHGDALDARCSLVILGDGRSNFTEPGLDVLERLRRRCRSVLWLCPEPESMWGRGDSRMRDYAQRVTRALPVSTLEELERAVVELPRL